jgi:hypothetical protein
MADEELVLEAADEELVPEVGVDELVPEVVVDELVPEVDDEELASKVGDEELLPLSVDEKLCGSIYAGDKRQMLRAEHVRFYTWQHATITLGKALTDVEEIQMFLSII